MLEAIVSPGPEPVNHWGTVDGIPIEVYACDFTQHAPPADFPNRAVLCVKTDSAWKVVLTQAAHDYLNDMGEQRPLSKEVAGSIAIVIERQIGALKLMRDQGLTTLQALDRMDAVLKEKFPQDYPQICGVFDEEPEEDLQFADADFGKEPLNVEELADEFDNRRDGVVSTPARHYLLNWLNRWVAWWRRRPQALRRIRRWQCVAVLLLVLLVVEGPRLYRIVRDIYGPWRAVNLSQAFPDIRWEDRTPDEVLQWRRVSRALYQAISRRNPFKNRGAVTGVTVRHVSPDQGYEWTTHLDGSGEWEQIVVITQGLSGKHMRALRNRVSGYRNLGFIMGYKAIMTWGHEGRFIVLFTLACLGVVVLLAKRAVDRGKALQRDMAIRNVAATGNVLQAVAEDGAAAENLLLFNQQRRLRAQDKRLNHPWEQDAFEWVELNLDPETGKTRQQQRDNADKL